MAENRPTCDFGSDPRTPCKYGSKCYRTNKIHVETYKHPPGTYKEETVSPGRQTKKLKLDACDQNINHASNEKETLVKSPSPKKPSREKETEKNTSVVHVSVKNKTRSPNSERVELKNDLKDLIRQLFLVSMPDDFYSLWEMCETLCKTDPLNALKEIKLKLVGPFDVLSGKVTEAYKEDLPDFLRHWRYYYDPPEFQTVLCSNDAHCYHLGYYRDDPKEMPVFMASNMLNFKNPEKNGELKVVGQNVFAALSVYLEELKTDPFSRMKIPKYQKILTSWANEKGFSLEKSSKSMESRSRKVVAKTFHGAGIVVPVDKNNDIGYRELAASNSMIKKMLKGIVDSKSEEERKRYWEQLQPVITFANIANDECDFGTSLELGLDLFTYGSPLFHRSVKQLLTTAYNLLGRTEFTVIIEAHLDDRRQGGNLSIL